MQRVSTRFFLITGLFVLCFSLFLLYRTHLISSRYVNEMLGQQADMALMFELSIRNYVNDNIRPVMYRYVGRDEFIPEAMSSSYVAHSVFQEVNGEFPDFILKFSAENPRNPANQAGPEEMEIIRYFNDHPEIKKWKGRIAIGGREYMATFHARRMERPCLRCHGDPKDAPVGLLERYGSTGGFHRPLGKVVALETIAIPINSINEKIHAEIRNNFLFTGLGLGLLMVTIIIATRYVITGRLTAIKDHFVTAAGQTKYTRLEPIEVEGRDEISSLASSFNILAEKLRSFYTSLESQIRETRRANEQLELEIEERERVEDALRHTESRYRNIFENAVDGIFQSTPEGRLISANPAFARIMGYDSADELMSDIKDIIPDSSAASDRLRQLLEKLESGPVSGFEIEISRKDGSIGWIALNARKGADEELGGEYIEAIVQDITRRKKAEEKGRKLEEQLRQAQKMESIGRLAGGIAHDFNNLLSSIMGYSEIALMQIPKDSPVYSDIETVYEAGKSAEALTRQLLAFGRRQVLETKTLDLNTVIRKTGKMLERVLGEDVEIEISTSSPLAQVSADAGQIEQILLNLAANARDAMRGGGKFSIETADVEIEEEYAMSYEGVNAGQYVMISVSDTGEGMTGEVLDHIFEPFFTTKEVGEGTGLGLATVYGIVMQHDGHVHAYSEPGKGTTIKIYLPAAEPVGEESGETERQEIPASESMGGETILVVDDEPSIRKLVTTALSQLGYTVLEASSGQEALDLAEGGEGIDLLLTDVIMPVMNGRELADIFGHRYPETRVVFMSGYTSNVIEHHGLMEEDVLLIQKPLRPAKLAAKLREVLDS